MNVQVKRKAQHTNQLQARHLQERILKVTTARISAINKAPKRKEPAEVKRARRIAEAWDRHESNLRDALYKRERARINSAASIVREVVLFGTPTEALHAVNEFERQFGVAAQP